LLYGVVAMSFLLSTQNVTDFRPVTDDRVKLLAWLESQPAELRVMTSHCFLPPLSGRKYIRTLDANDDLAALDLIIVQSRRHYCDWYQDPYKEIRKKVIATGDFALDASPVPDVVVFHRMRQAILSH